MTRQSFPIHSFLLIPATMPSGGPEGDIYDSLGIPPFTRATSKGAKLSFIVLTETQLLGKHISRVSEWVRTGSALESGALNWKHSVCPAFTHVIAHRYHQAFTGCPTGR